jgi:hypothetical protein
MLMRALAYGLGLFAAGLLLGTLRVTMVAPRLGETVAVALELPLMLGFAWLFAGWLVRSKPGHAGGEWLIAGAGGFAVLMLCEAGLGMTAFGLSAAEFLAGLTTGPGALGLAAQMATAFLPFAQFTLARRGQAG